MKQYTFKDGFKCVAGSVEEAKARHRVVASRGIKIGDIKEYDELYNLMNDDLDLLDYTYSDKEIEWIKRAFNTIEAKKLVSDIKKDYAVYKKETKKYFDAIKNAKKPFQSKVKELQKLMDSLLSRLGDTHIRETTWGMWETILKKSGVNNPKVDVDGEEEYGIHSDGIESSFKSKSGKRVTIAFWVESGWDDEDGEYHDNENPKIEDIEVTYDGKKLKCDGTFKNMKKSTIKTVAPAYIKDLYEDTLKLFTSVSSPKFHKVVK